MKKIIIITDTWRPQINGVVTAIEKTSQQLIKQGLVVTIVHPGMFFTTPFPFYPEIKLAFFFGALLRKILLEDEPNYIHIATEGPLGYRARRICLHHKLIFTTSYHTHFPYYIGYYLRLRVSRFLFDLTYRYLAWFHNAGAATMVSTESLRQELLRHNFKNPVICPLGVEIDLFTRNDQSTIPKFLKPVFIYMGRVSKEKNIEEYLRCHLPGTKLVIGDGPARKTLEKQYGGNALFVGYKKNQELVDWLSVGDVLVFPSRTDTFSLAIIESLACGVPVAAHDVMGPRDIITSGVDGFLDENLERAALACLNLSRLACVGKARKFSWSNSAQTFIANLKENNYS